MIAANGIDVSNQSQSIEMLPIFNKHKQINCFVVSQRGNE